MGFWGNDKRQQWGAGKWMYWRRERKIVRSIYTEPRSPVNNADLNMKNGYFLRAAHKNEQLTFTHHFKLRDTETIRILKFILFKKKRFCHFFRSL